MRVTYTVDILCIEILMIKLLANIGQPRLSVDFVFPLSQEEEEQQQQQWQPISTRRNWANEETVLKSFILNLDAPSDLKNKHAER